MSSQRTNESQQNDGTAARIFLSLGSNIGGRAANIARAIAAMGKHGVRVTRQSSLYETEPVDFRGQAWFLNCVIAAETSLAPRQLLRALLEIEAALGRERRIPKGPRVIDIDILLYGESVLREPDLKIPHPRMAERRFVLVPLAEIAPAIRNPLSKKSASQLLAETSDRSEVKIFAPKDAHATR